MADLGGIADQRCCVLIAVAEMGVEQFADEGARHDGALVDIERQPAQIDLVDEIGGGFARGDAALDQSEDLFAFRRGDARMGKLLELVGMQVQGLADEERGFRDGIGGAVGEDEFGLAQSGLRRSGRNRAGSAIRPSRLWAPWSSALWLSRAWPSRLGPARGGRIIMALRLDPAGAAGAFLALPERRIGLEIIHQEFSRLERGLPVLRGRHDQHDVLPRRDAPDGGGSPSVLATASAPSPRLRAA